MKQRGKRPAQTSCVSTSKLTGPRWTEPSSYPSCSGTRRPCPSTTTCWNQPREACALAGHACRLPGRAGGGVASRLPQGDPGQVEVPARVRRPAPLKLLEAHSESSAAALAQTTTNLRLRVDPIAPWSVTTIAMAKGHRPGNTPALHRDEPKPLDLDRISAVARFRDRSVRAPLGVLPGHGRGYPSRLLMIESGSFAFNQTTVASGRIRDR